MIDLPTSFSTFSSGGQWNDTVTPQLTAMNAHAATLAATPATATLATSITAATAAIATQWATHQSGLSIMLPAMKAVHMQESKLSMANGGIAPSTGSTSFSTFLNAHIGIQTEVGTLNVSIGALVGGTTTAASVTAQLTSSQANITSHISTASSTFTSGVASLSAMSFAKFCSSPQPAAISSALTVMVNPATVAPTAAFNRASASVSAWLKGQPTTSDGTTPVVAKVGSPDVFTLNPATPAPTFTASPCSTTQLNAILAQIDSQHTVLQVDAAAADVSANQFMAWQTSVNYQAIKNAQGNNSVALAQYQALKAQALQHPAYITMQAQMVTYNADRKRLSDLQNISTYMRTTGPWPGNPNGPW